MLPASYNIVEIKIADEIFRIAQPHDPEVLFNELLQNDKNHPDVVDEKIPYWAELWPSAIGLSEFILEHRDIVNGKSVLEIGCGLGLPGIVAARCGGIVTMTDYLQPALNFAEYNWQLNFSTKPDLQLLDWRNTESMIPYDVVIASDIAYEKKSFESVIKSLNSLIKKGGTILLSEPNRNFAKEFFAQLKKSGFSISEETKMVFKNGIQNRISVYILK
jgi:predicted nicotinamide N-methyase